MRISIVIPVYNVAPYVEKCLASVMAQAEPDIECIVVDDASTDGSLEIVRRLINAYPGPVEFRLEIHGQNRGQSAARNTGTRLATGECVFYLDSDDELLPDGLARLAAVARQDGPDFVIGAHAVCGKGDPVVSPRLGPGLIEGGDEILSAFLRGDWPLMPWNKLLRREFIERNQLRFEEGLVLEDELWSLIVACRAKTMGVVEQATYLQRIRDNSTMTSNAVARRFSSWMNILRLMDSFVKSEGLDGNIPLKEYIEVRRSELSERARRSGGNSYEIYQREIRGAARFDRRVFRAMGLGWKIRYLHYLLPVPLGYAYLWGTMRVIPWLARMRRIRPSDFMDGPCPRR